MELLRFLIYPALIVAAQILLTPVSPLLAEVVILALFAIPVLWSLNELRTMGSEAFASHNLLYSIFLLLSLPAVAGVIYGLKNDKGWITIVSIIAFCIFANHAISGILDKLLIGNMPEDGDEVVRRGSRVVDAEAMNKMRSQDKAGSDSSAVKIGGVAIPRTLEAQHFLISGTTGAGKTQVINGILRSVRKRGEKAIIADPAGGFYARFGQSGDVLLNPFDSRSVDWSPFAEIRHDYDCDRIASAIIPTIHAGESAQWQLFAQTLLAKAMLAMHREGDHSMKKLLYWMNSAMQKDLEPLLAGTAAAVLTQKGNDKMLNNTRATMVPYLAALEYLPDEGTFSIRDWVRSEGRSNWLFVTYRDDQMSLLRNLVATALEMALVEGLSLSESQDRGLWFIMDEVDSLGKITSLRGGLTKLRKYGGRCVLGLQTVSQLRTTYGRDEAQTLVANTSVKCILRAGDAETAKSMESELGDQEITRYQVNDSFSSNSQGGSSSSSTSTQVVRQSAVLASEVMGLPDLQGFLKMPGDEIARIKVDYVSMPEVNPAFQ